MIKVNRDRSEFYRGTFIEVPDSDFQSSCFYFVSFSLLSKFSFILFPPFVVVRLYFMQWLPLSQEAPLKTKRITILKIGYKIEFFLYSNTI